MSETVMERRRTPRMLLSREGKILDTTAMQALGLTADAILTMYRHMLLTRLFCDAANASARHGQMTLFISSKGQEAAEVASATALAAHDWIFWYLRAWGAAITRGISSDTLFKWRYGVEDQQVVAHILARRSMLPYILVGNHLPHAVGFAASTVMHGEDAVIMAYFGDGATSTAFVYAMLNHIVAHMARFRQRSAGCLSQSVTVVLPYGGGIPLIKHHREEEVAPFLNSPGLTIGCPATPQEFYDLAWAAAASEKPVLLFIPKLFYRDSSLRSSLCRRIPDKAIEHFGARLACAAPESDTGGVTVITFGRMVSTALAAVQRATQHGIPVEVLALRTLKPLPLEAIFHSVEKTKRLVTVEETPVSGGFGEHLVANVTRDPTMLATLWAAPRCVGAPDLDHPPALRQLYSPDRRRLAGD